MTSIRQTIMHVCGEFFRKHNMRVVSATGECYMATHEGSIRLDEDAVAMYARITCHCQECVRRQDYRLLTIKAQTIVNFSVDYNDPNMVPRLQEFLEILLKNRNVKAAHEVYER